MTQGKFAIVDPDDYYRLCKHKWHTRKIHNGFYAVHSQRVRGEKGKVEHVLMHREVLAVGEGRFVDHANRNGLDNRKANLRAATRSENGMNRGKYRRGRYRSRYKGLSWHPGQRKWLAYIKAKGRKVYLGKFEDEVQAAKAYDLAAEKYHGDFASLNFPHSKRSASCHRKHHYPTKSTSVSPSSNEPLILPVADIIQERLHRSV